MKEATSFSAPRIRWTVLAGGIALLVGCSSNGTGSGTFGADTSGGGVRPAGTVIANSGFVVETNGFGFENYANTAGIQNLDAAAMRVLFGDQVCARVADGACTLSPTAAKWMTTQNDGMNAGHCFGIAGLSWAIFKGTCPPPNTARAPLSR